MVFIYSSLCKLCRLRDCGSRILSGILVAGCSEVKRSFLNCNEFCTNEGRGNAQKKLWQVKQV